MAGRIAPKGEGATKWLVPDGFWDSKSHGQPSHEALCVLNTGPHDAEVLVTLYFEDREKMGGFRAVVPAERTKHLRMDRWLTDDGRAVPQDVPYAMTLESSVPVVVQYSRLDTAQAELALMTTIAYRI